MLRDFHQCWQGQARIIRKLRNLAQKLKYTRKTMVVTMPSTKIPEELKDDMVLLEFQPPGVPELDNILTRLTAMPGVKVNKARDYGLPAPKGIALIGIPGTGKSLTAKMIAGLWHLPLIRLDVGALFGGLVGQSEENTRRALALAETVAPCLLWIDEIEKGLASGGGDGGTSMRVFGSILSWM